MHIESQAQLIASECDPACTVVVWLCSKGVSVMHKFGKSSLLLVVGVILAMFLSVPSVAHAVLYGDINRYGNAFGKYDPPCPVSGSSRWKDRTSSWGMYTSEMRTCWVQSQRYANAALKYNAAKTVRKTKAKYKNKPVVSVMFTNKYSGQRLFSGRDKTHPCFATIVEPWITYRNGGESDNYSKDMKKDYILVRKGQTVHLYPMYIVWYESLYGRCFSNSFDYHFTNSYKGRGSIRDYEQYHGYGLSNTVVSAKTHLPYGCRSSNLKSSGYAYKNTTGKDIYLLVTMK